MQDVTQTYKEVIVAGKGKSPAFTYGMGVRKIGRVRKKITLLHHTMTSRNTANKITLFFLLFYLTSPLSKL